MHEGITSSSKCVNAPGCYSALHSQIVQANVMADAVGALKQFCRDVASCAYPQAGYLPIAAPTWNDESQVLSSVRDGESKSPVTLVLNLVTSVISCAKMKNVSQQQHRHAGPGKALRQDQR